MRKIIAVCLLILLSHSPVHAIDFTVLTASESGTLVTSNISISNATTTNCPNNICYLFASLQKTVGDAFFGDIQNNQKEWISYRSESNLTTDFIKSAFYLVNITDKSWQGSLVLRYDPSSSAYKGPGDYRLSIFRYTGNSSSYAGDPAVYTVALSAPLPTPTPSPSPSPTPSPIPTPTPSPSPTPTPKPSPTLLTVASAKASPSPIPSPSPEGEVAGVSTEIDLSGFGVSPSPVGADYHPPVRPSINRSRLKIILMIGSGLIILSVAGFLGYKRYLDTINK